jgi:predicted Zn-dependent protease with MMP-like domain
MMRLSRAQFEELVAKALDDLPEEFAELLENVAVVVEEEPSDEDLVEVGIDPGDPERDELFGLYQGVAQPERGAWYTALPDRVAIFRGPILRCCESRREILREVRETVVHELGHHFGLDEDDMPF